jgi:hypothetical protein
MDIDSLMRELQDIPLPSKPKNSKNVKSQSQNVHHDRKGVGNMRYFSSLH